MTDILEILKNSNKNLFVGLAGPGTGKSYTFKKIIEYQKALGIVSKEVFLPEEKRLKLEEILRGE